MNTTIHIFASITVGLAALLGLGAATAYAEDAIDHAKAAQNPVADLISLPIQDNLSFNAGPEEEVQNVLNIQPVWPIGVTDKWNVITRTIIPIVSQPPESVGGDRKDGLGDTTFTAFLSPKEPGAVIWGAGPVLLLPTSTSNKLGAGEFGLGPSVLALAMPGSWVVGSLVSNVWSVTGDKRVNLFTWQVIANYNLPDGWYLTSTPIITADWKERDGNRWTVPLGGGVGKVFKVGKMPVNGQIQAFYNVVRPDKCRQLVHALPAAAALPEVS
jgi:hypothetical protein